MSSVDREYAITQYKVRLQLNSGSSMRLEGASVGHSRRGSTRERKAQQRLRIQQQRRALPAPDRNVAC